MLGRFVAPAERLVDLSDTLRRLEPSSALPFSILASGADKPERFLIALEADLRAAAHFASEHRDKIAIDQIEARLPLEIADTDVVTVRRFLDSVSSALQVAERDSADVFFEIPLDDELRQRLPILSGAVKAFNRDRADEADGRFGVKMRTGSTNPSEVSSVEDVAHMIVSCRDADVPYKATAGLHHPIRRVHEDFGGRMHGFLNVFLAAALAEAHGLQADDVCSVLAAEDPQAFELTDRHASWNRLSVDVPTIERVRRRRAVSFGSCSFVEPVSDLKALDLI